jgi:ABC-type Mn2+/Zn2+ transport system ATPase subunit
VTSKELVRAHCHVCDLGGDHVLACRRQRTEQMKKQILKVRDLSVELGGERIIKNLNFGVNEREVMIILGPNGAGKSTLLKALLGLVPYSGEVSWVTKDISYLPPQELFQRRDVLLNVGEFFKLRNASQEKASGILKRVGLSSSMLQKNFGSLSTGQFQRMIIAWALVDEPSVLLFDEPTSGIDVGGQDTVYSLLHYFWEHSNLTILLVTHDLNIVWEHADNVLCVNKKQVCCGPPRKVLTPESLEELYGTGVKYYVHGHRKY